MTTTSGVWTTWWARGGRKWTTEVSAVSSRLRPTPASAARAPPLELPTPLVPHQPPPRRPLETWRELPASSFSRMLHLVSSTSWPSSPPWGASFSAMTPGWSPGRCSYWSGSWTWAPCGRRCSYQVLWPQPPSPPCWAAFSTGCSGAECAYCSPASSSPSGGSSLAALPVKRCSWRVGSSLDWGSVGFRGVFRFFEIRGRKRGGWGLRNFNKKNSELRKCGGNGANKISVDTDINQFHSTK